MTLRFLFALALAGPALYAAPAFAQPEAVDEAPAQQTALEMRAEQVVALINGELDVAYEEVFTPAFLAAVPASQLEAISAQLTGQFGAALSVEELGNEVANRSSLAIRMERAIARGGIAIDPAQGNRISELRFQTFDPIDDSLEKIEADLDALPGTVSAWFGPVEAGDAVLSINADEPMALGSTFKLYVLAALADDIARGERAWSEVVGLDASSYPSGQLQDWPQRAPITLHSLAAMMISISDNTATDQLIDVLGRSRIEQVVAQSGHADPALNEPFLTTREMFLLKGGPADRLEAYRTGSLTQRGAILSDIESIEVPIDQIASALSGDPMAIDVEWFASAADLRALMRFIKATDQSEVRDIMAISPSVPASIADEWSYVGYKGGSEPGVLNLTWLLTDDSGRDHMLTLGWNNPDAPLDGSALELIAQRILSLAR